MEHLSYTLSVIDDIVWGPVLISLMLGTGIFLTIRTRFLPWRNLFFGIRSSFSGQSHISSQVTGDVSPFASLATALAATIGTGNIVGVTTAMVAGGPGALVWMWISAAFGISTKFGECMLAVKYREINQKGEMSGGPMYVMKKGFQNKRSGKLLGFFFAFFTILASFGIGNMTQANSISEALSDTFRIPEHLTGLLVTLLALLVIAGGIKNISRVATFMVPLMAVFYLLACLFVIIINIRNLPVGLYHIFSTAFCPKSVTGGFLGTITASMMHSIRYGIARGVFSNEAGMGSTAITAAAASTDNPVRQGYISMTDTFWDTLVVCTMTGLCVACSGILGTGSIQDAGEYAVIADELTMTGQDGSNRLYAVTVEDQTLTLTSTDSGHRVPLLLTRLSSPGTWRDPTGNIYTFYTDGHYEYTELYNGAVLTIEAFKTALGDLGAWLVTIGIVLFAFATILGWEYHGEKAWEYVFKTHKFNLLYRIIFSCTAYVGATTALDIVWNFSDIANALMSIPNLICLLVLSGEIAKDAKAFQKIK